MQILLSISLSFSPVEDFGSSFGTIVESSNWFQQSGSLILSQEGLSTVAKYKRPLLVHVEVQHEVVDDLVKNCENDVRGYSSYLRTRPPSREQAVISNLLKVSENTRAGGSAEGAFLHIVHLSDAGSSLNMIKVLGLNSWGDSVRAQTNQGSTLGSQQ